MKVVPIFIFLILQSSILSCQNISNNTNTSMPSLFEFKGDFHTRIILKEFARLDNPTLGRYDNDLEQGEFGLYIDDAEDMNPDPSAEQIKAIHYLQQHQQEILESVFHFCKEKVIPDYKEFLPPADYPEAYPKLAGVADLPSFIGVNEIMIKTSHKDGSAYIVLGFTSMLDIEHGLYIIMHQLRPIGHGTMGDLEYDKMVENMNAGKKPEEMPIPKEKLEVDGIIQPHPKYGKLKPWQKSHNLYYPYKFVREDRMEELQQFFEQNSAATKKYKHATGLLELAVRWKKSEMVDYLLTQKPARVISAFEIALRNQDFPLAKRLIVYETNINGYIGQDAFLFKILRQFYKNYAEEVNRSAYELLIETTFQQGGNPFIQEKFGRDALFCYRYFENEKIKEEIDTLVKNYCRKYGVAIPEK